MRWPWRYRGELAKKLALQCMVFSAVVATIVTAAELGVEVWPAARKRAAERLVARGRLLVEGGLLRVPRAGWLFADGTAAELF